MPSWRDYVNIEGRELTSDDLREAINILGNVANKRLKRMANSKKYGSIEHPYAVEPEEQLKGEEYISGVRKFEYVKKADLDQYRKVDLVGMYHRALHFLKSRFGGIQQIEKNYREFQEQRERASAAARGHKYTKKEIRQRNIMRKQKDTRREDRSGFRNEYAELQGWLKSWKIYNRMIDMGAYAPTTQDSSQVQNIVQAAVIDGVSKGYDDEQLMEYAKKQLGLDYEAAILKDEDDEGISTSTLISMGASD